MKTYLCIFDQDGIENICVIKTVDDDYVIAEAKLYFNTNNSDAFIIHNVEDLEDGWTYYDRN